ncbi:Crp/Fnr family transcriptional regulator [Aliiglaciecola sp.]|nr:Crp/Fnr family transcriptional regulator [Aliiglaciecola sp.]
MTIFPSVHSTNQLLQFLPPNQRQTILKLCQPFTLDVGKTLIQSNKPIKYVYFPTSGFISLFATICDERPLEMGLIGNEGMLGATLALGHKNAPIEYVVKGAGSALSMESIVFQQCMVNSPVFEKLIHNYLYFIMLQSLQTGACNNFHEVQKRLPRLLLLIQDRVQSNHFYCTHRLLATMLGVRRSAVTISASALQQKGFIRYNRGHIQVTSRQGLMKASCSCYLSAINIYQKTLNTP